jgi:hypothetical protein
MIGDIQIETPDGIRTVSAIDVKAFEILPPQTN